MIKCITCGKEFVCNIGKLGFCPCNISKDEEKCCCLPCFYKQYPDVLEEHKEFDRTYECWQGLSILISDPELVAKFI